MATQIGAINVRIDNQSPKVQTISYGGKTIKGSTDMVLGTPQTGQVISYVASNGNFILSSASSLIPNLDAGFF